MNSPSRDPDVEVEAEIVAESGSLGMLPTRTWLPSHPWEAHFVEILSWDFRHKDLLGQHLIVQAPLRSVGSPRSSAIIARGLRVETTRLSFSGLPSRPAVILGGTAEQLILAEQKRPDTGSDDGPSDVLFRITNNSLLRPFEQRSCHPDGNVVVMKDGPIRLDVPVVGDLKFDSQYYYTNNPDGSMTAHRGLICSASVHAAAVDVDSVLRQFVPRIRRILLLASLAARERTEICGWDAECRNWKVAVHLGRDSHQEQHPERGSIDWLIRPEEFAEFLQRSATILEQLPTEQRSIMTSAIRRAVGAPGASMEHQYLASFAALESIISWHKTQTGSQTSIRGKPWSDLLRALRRTVHDNAGLFESERHRQLLERVLPRIQQIPASDAFRSFVDDHQIDLGSVWPVYGKVDGCTLADIRNRLAHGDSSDKWYPEAMASAFRNLQVTLERSILAVLKWPIDHSHASGSALSEVDWLASQDLSGFQKLFRLGREERGH